MGDDPHPGEDHLPVPFEPEWVADDGDTGEPKGISRRQFLTFTVAGGAAAGTMSRGQWLRHVRRSMVGVASGALAAFPGTPSIVIHAERDVDLVTLDFAFYSFTIAPGTPPRIAPTHATNFVLVQFPPQAIGEAVYFNDTLDSFGRARVQADPAPILSEMAGPSRLVFALDQNQAIPLPTMSVADLLNWGGWRLYVPPVANWFNVNRRSAPAPVTPPGELTTSIECPYALFLSPTDRASFGSRRAPLTSSDNVTGLWGTSLILGEGRDTDVVATYARDYAGPGAPPPLPNATPERFIDYSPPVIIDDPG